VVLESVAGNPANLSELPIFAARDKVVYSFHMYQPLKYTHQGIDPDGSGPLPVNPSKVSLSDKIIAEAGKTLSAVQTWQAKNHTRVFVGEFSVNRAAPGATDYLNLCLTKFEKLGWDWTYHAYRTEKRHPNLISSWVTRLG
jgi:hypothetical protein